MGITISGASTQIPTNVVEVGNEITQNQLNAITASAVPSLGNPLQTYTALQGFIASNVSPTLAAKVTSPALSWTHPFPYNGNFVTVLRPDTGLWWPWNGAGQLLATVTGNSEQSSYNFDFMDASMQTISLNGTADVGLNATNYNALGYWDSISQSTYSSNVGISYFPATGPTYAGNWDNPIASAYFYDGMSYNYRYVYLAGGGGFYTADHANNPPS